MCQSQTTYGIAATDSTETPFKCHTASLHICLALSWAAAGTGSQPLLLPEVNKIGKSKMQLSTPCSLPCPCMIPGPAS